MDVDIVVHLEGDDGTTLLKAFAELDYYTPPPEVVAVELARPTRGHFNVIHTSTGQKADFYPSLKHPYWSWAWAHRQLGSVGSDEVYFAPPEYVILWKLEFFREGGGDKHVRDIRGMLLMNAETIDRSMLDQACAEVGLTSLWQAVAGKS